MNSSGILRNGKSRIASAQAVKTASWSRRGAETCCSSRRTAASAACRILPRSPSHAGAGGDMNVSGGLKAGIDQRHGCRAQAAGIRVSDRVNRFHHVNADSLRLASYARKQAVPPVRFERHPCLTALSKSCDPPTGIVFAKQSGSDLLLGNLTLSSAQ
jgi:hypothetical protein